MRSAVKVLVGITLLLASLSPPAAAVTGASTASDGETVMQLDVTRTREGIRLRACLPGMGLADVDGTTPGGVARTRIGGVLVAESTTAVAWALPGLSGDPACAGSVYFDEQIALGQLATAGVVVRTGQWVTFTIEVEVRVAARSLPFVARRSFTIGAGPPIGAVTSTTSTADGTIVRGWVVHPSIGAVGSLTVTVDGQRWRPASTYPLPLDGRGQLSTNRATSDPRWIERGLGDQQDFELLVPPGRICILAPDLRAAGLADVPVGCTTSVTDGRARAVISRIDPLSAPGSSTSRVRIRGTVTDPWAGPTERPQLTLTAGPIGDPVLAVAAPDLRGPLSDGSGAFRFDHTFSSINAGNVRFCVRASYATAPEWWLQLIGPPPAVDRELACSTVYVPSQVPAAPTGALERIDVVGRTVTARGWAFDPNGGTPQVLLSVNGFPAAIGRASLRRPDIARTLGAQVDPGYELSAELPAGTHDTCVAWQDTTTGRWSSPTCRSTVVK